MNYLQEIGPLAIASRLKNLSEMLIEDMIDVYRNQHLDFEPRWFSFVHLIHHKGPLPITHIARELNQTHPAANQVANALEKKGIVLTKREKSDSRKRIIKLSPHGKELVKELEPVWESTEHSVNELLSQACPQLFDCIEAIEQKLTEKPMKERILSHLQTMNKQDIQIIDYSTDYKNEFKELNEAWLKHYFKIEPEDSRLLNDPDKEIIMKGGYIVFATDGNSIIGTGAILRVDSNTCELTKMAVTPQWQGKQVGRKILRRLISDARSRNYKKMILLTSEKLNKAVSLYLSEGFSYTDTQSMQKHNFQRCSIQMEINLNNNKQKTTS